MPLSDFIVHNPNPESLECGWVKPKELEARIRWIEASAAPLVDEQVLTYLCAYGYAIAPGGPQALARELLQKEALAYDGKIWLEFLPTPPRNQEGETHFDLAVGDVRVREPTHSGLEFDPPRAARHSWVAVVEAKLRSDLSAHVRYDAFRNQLLRVIENAVTLSNKDSLLPASVHVVLLTPKIFKDNPRTRYYGCKFEEYCPNGRVEPEAVLADLQRLQLQTVAYGFPLAERLNCLSLRWATYEDLISKMPDEHGFRTCLLQLMNRRGSLVSV